MSITTDTMRETEPGRCEHRLIPCVVILGSED